MNLPGNTLITALLLCNLLQSGAQDSKLYMPSELSRAYENKTRSWDGRPGRNYWQNKVDYEIDVSVIPAERLIDGREKVTFYNNSPDEINSLVIRLYGDLLRRGNARDRSLEEENLTGGVVLSDVSVDGKRLDMKDRERVQRRGTNLFIELPAPLLPGSKLVFECSWQQYIPLAPHSRTAAYDSSTFFIAYWYPQIAVYDDIFGWDEMDDAYQREYYNNLGNYRVNITVPENYLVWATGTLKNSKTILPEENQQKYKQARFSEIPVQIVSAEDLENGFQTLHQTWTYHAGEVSDFAFALSDHYLWEAAAQRVDGRPVLISAAYPADDEEACAGLVEVQQKAMKHFSEDVPGIPYPYEAFTTFINGGYHGMEFPMMANNGQPNIAVTIHEIFHTYLPMYVRTNERRWAWMDEGLAVYNTTLLTFRFFMDRPALYDVFSTGYDYRKMGTAIDLPLITQSQFLSPENHHFNTYTVSAALMAILHHQLGEALFMKCYRAFIRRWARKSPTPYDFFLTFEDVSGQNLQWLWEPWFFKYGFADVAIGSFEQGRLGIINKGNKPVPVFAEIHYRNKDTAFIEYPAKIWKEGPGKLEIQVPQHENLERILVNKNVADRDITDNVYPSLASFYQDTEVPTGIFGKYEMDNGDIFSVERREGAIYIVTPRFNKVIVPASKTYYQALDESFSVTFGLNESGRINRLEMNLRGNHMYCRKISDRPY